MKCADFTLHCLFVNQPHRSLSLTYLTHFVLTGIEEKMCYSHDAKKAEQPTSAMNGFAFCSTKFHYTVIKRVDIATVE